MELAFPIVHPGKELIAADYLGLMATLLMRVEQRKYKRVTINLPPRHMKSLLVSILYIAWRMGRDPTVQFICISYGDDLAHEHAAATRKVMQDPLYREIFPGTILDKAAFEHIRTTRGGYRCATAVGSDITGFGADEIIIDDPMQPEDAASERQKAQLRDWVGSSVLTRLNNPNTGVVVLVMHRLAPDDFSSTFRPMSDFELRLPLIGEKEERFTSRGVTLLHREPGDVLNPERFSKAEAEKLRATLDPHVFSSQYQQNPQFSGSGMLSADNFTRYDPTDTRKF